MNASWLVTFVVSVSSCFASQGRNTWVNASWNYEYYASGGRTDSVDLGNDSCHLMDATLIVIHNSETQEFLESIIKPGSGVPYAFFIGLRSHGKNWDFTWDDGTQLTDDSFKFWEPGEPSHATDSCVVIGTPFAYSSSLQWYDVDCGRNQPRGYFCQRRIGLNWGNWKEWEECRCPGIKQRMRTCVDSGRPGKNLCAGESIDNTTCTPPAGCNSTLPVITTTPKPKGRGDWFTHSGYQYYVSEALSKDRTFVQSQDWCRKYDAELALVKSPDIQSFIASLVLDNSGLPYAFYIGLQFSGEANSGHQWTDGTSVVYENWAEGEPNNKDSAEHCVVMGDIYNFVEGLPWQDRRCIGGKYGRKGFVCQRRIGRYWNEWSAYSGCNCSTTVEIRERRCVDSGRPGPNHCSGPSAEEKKCSLDSRCFTTSHSDKSTRALAKSTTAILQPIDTTSSNKMETTSLKETATITGVAATAATAISWEMTSTRSGKIQNTSEAKSLSSAQTDAERMTKNSLSTAVGNARITKWTTEDAIKQSEVSSPSAAFTTSSTTADLRKATEIQRNSVTAKEAGIISTTGQRTLFSTSTNERLETTLNFEVTAPTAEKRTELTKSTEENSVTSAAREGNTYFPQSSRVNETNHQVITSTEIRKTASLASIGRNNTDSKTGIPALNSKQSTTPVTSHPVLETTENLLETSDVKPTEDSNYNYSSTSEGVYWVIGISVTIVLVLVFIGMIYRLRQWKRSQSLSISSPTYNVEMDVAMTGADDRLSPEYLALPINFPDDDDDVLKFEPDNGHTNHSFEEDERTPIKGETIHPSTESISSCNEVGTSATASTRASKEEDDNIKREKQMDSRNNHIFINGDVYSLIKK